jgi:hypothetical protein
VEIEGVRILPVVSGRIRRRPYVPTKTEVDGDAGLTSGKYEKTFFTTLSSWKTQ